MVLAVPARRGTVDELHRAGADPDRVLIVEVSESYPRAFGVGHEYRHALHVDEVILPGSTLQTGMGSIPSQIATLLAEGEGGGASITTFAFGSPEL